MAEITRQKYAVVETNHVHAVRTGNIAAQYPATAILENGMAVAVNHDDKTIELPTAATNPVYLHHSEESLYDSNLGRNNFRIEKGEYPRALKLEEGDIFETNAFSGDIVKGGTLHPATTGLWDPAGTVATITAKVIDLVTLPNGEQGAKLVIVPNAE